MPFNRLMKDIGTLSKTMSMVKQLRLPKNWTNVVTTKGASPWILQPNDGIVTIESMTARKDMNLIELDVNHYEVVLSKKTVDIIKQQLKL